MQIAPLNSFNFKAYSNKLPFFGSANSFSNLAPLAKDTVSFSGKTSPSDVKKMNLSERPRKTTAEKIYKGSEYAYKNLKFIISQNLDSQVIDIDGHNAEEKLSRAINDNNGKPIVAITGRRKSARSIAEKMASQKLRSISGTKETLNDLIGVRIILSGKSTQEGDSVLDDLTEAVKMNRLKIKEIKNHNQEDPSLNYVTNGKITKLLSAARKTYPTCKYIDEPRDSGYLAVHIITDEIADGYNGEIQIMGLDVARFKGIEDLCYKCLAGKEIPSKYAPIAKHFEQLKDNDKLKQDYMEYTKRAYARERRKPMHKAHEYEEFLSIPKDLSISKELDFNNITKEIRKIDSKKRSPKS